MNKTPLCHFDDVPENCSKGFTLNNNESVFAVKKDNQLYIYKNRCPHLGIPLEWLEDQFLDSDSALIQCSTHGALFIITDGECIAGPCVGKALEAIPHTRDETNTIYIAI